MLIVIVFMAGYAAIAMEHKVGVNKTATALLAAVACWVLLALRSSGNIAGVTGSFGLHLQETSEVVFFLIGAMTVVQLMDTHGGFQVVTKGIRARDKKQLLWIVSFMTFVLSSVLGLLPTAIVMAAIFPRMLEDKEDRLVLASMIIISANAGGAWSPIGDVTTTMLWIGGRVSAFGLAGKVIVSSLCAMLVPLVYFSLTMQNGPVSPVEGARDSVQPGAKRVFGLGLAALVFVPIFKLLTGLPPVAGMLLGLGVMWLVTDLMHGEQRVHLKVPEAFSRIDLASVLFFLGILLAIAALESAGILAQLAGWMDVHVGNKDIIATLIGLASAVVDNVPLTAATMGMYDLARYPMDSKLWELLAFSVGTGGSILIIGSAAGVVVMGLEKINFMWYLRKVSLPALLGYFAGIAAYLVIYRLGV
ncbi:MAG: sodium:proton antiporter [Candidatus Omnitrophica bacterium]|nr:sodium:proton antiporter [Candidatus Omnitrophota bacterium]